MWKPLAGLDSESERHTPIDDPHDGRRLGGRCIREAGDEESGGMPEVQIVIRAVSTLRHNRRSNLLHEATMAYDQSSALDTMPSHTACHVT